MVTCLPHSHISCRPGCLARGQRDGLTSSNENTRSGEGVAWQGPRTVVLRKNAQGFGFTLRHFIVYPPESAMHVTSKDEENGNGTEYQRSNLEPMDTIFVKNVREKGPAHQAGLCTGDRLVKVNGESVLGKTYSQVIALIQNCESVLELSIMPRDEDVLQLAYSQDAYLRGNEPYRGGARDLPEPPSVCYPRSRAQQSMGHHQTDNLGCWMASTRLTSPLDNRSGRGSPAGRAEGQGLEPGVVCRSSPIHRTEEVQYGTASQQAVGQARGYTPSSCSSSGPAHVSPPHGQYSNHSSAAAPTPQVRVGPQPWASPPPAVSKSERQQALAEWYYSQVPERRAPSMPPRYRSFSQDRLGEVGLGPPLGPHRMGWPHSASHDTLLVPPGPGQSGEGSWGGEWDRARSENLLAAAYDRHGRSLEMLDRVVTVVPPRFEPSTWLQQFQLAPARTQGHQRSGTHFSSAAAPPAGGQGQVRQQQQQQQQQQQPRRLALQSVDDQPVGYRSYSPSFYRKAGRLMQAHSFRDPCSSGPHFTWAPSPKTSPQESTAVASLAPPASLEPRDRTRQSATHEPTEEEEPTPQAQEVVLRQKPPMGRRVLHAQRQPHYGLTVEAAEALGLRAECPDMAVPRTGGGPRRTNGGLAPLSLEHDSLATIPFIDEPTSPSADLRAHHVPASSVVSSALSSAPAVTNSPASPTFTFPLSRLFSHDCSSIKSGRRSSYLLAITTERSKSCDEGLNTFRDEGHMFSRLPKRVKSFFTDGSLESLAATELRSKRHSTSELGSVTFTDIRKEGWLHFKQILTEKGKKVGASMRPWKRVFSVLRLHSLFLYKDKREAVLRGAALVGGAGGGPGEDEQPINIRGCLVDIAYSETKRKNALRLTTQDFCEYLLQAEDREDMLAWIKVIRENGKTDSEELGFSGQALINKKLNDYRKQSPTGNKPDSSPRVPRIIPPFLMAKMDNVTGAPRSPKPDGKAEESSPPKSPWGINIMKKAKKSGPKAFGVRLEDCQPAVNNKFVPLVVEICCGLVEQMGVEYTGIYRVPGNNAIVSTLQDQLNKGMDINLSEEKWQDQNVVSSLLKSFFRKLPEPLFTDDKYNDFIEANRMENPGERLRTMRKLIHDLPDYFFHTLKFLIGHLKTVADHSEKNKMEPRNLALVFGPTLVRTSEDNMTDMVTHMPDRYKIVETLIQHCTWFFSDELDKDEKTPEDKEDLQPIPNIDHLLSNIGRTGPLGEASDSTNSDSAKSKGSWGSKRDLSAKDLLSIMSAVTRKRKKRPSARLLGSSTDEDSEHEPMKASHRGGNRGAEGGDTAPKAEGEEDDEEEEEEEDEEGGGRETVEEGPSQKPCEEEESGVITQGEGPEAGRGQEDARSIVSGYSTLSTLGRGPASEGRADEADDERSELVSETDNESGFASRSLTQERPEKAARSQSQPPRSFLYMHCKPPTAATAPTPRPPSDPGETSDGAGRSTTPSSLSSSSTAHRLNTRPSFNSHKLIQCDTLARKKTRAEKGKGRPLSSELVLEPAEEEEPAGKGPAAKAVASQSEATGVGRPPPTVPSSNPASEAAFFSPVGTGRGSLAEQVRARLLGSADDLRSIGLRKPLSPDTRQRRRAWRRHTVVVSPSSCSANLEALQDSRPADTPVSVTRQLAARHQDDCIHPRESEPTERSDPATPVTQQAVPSRFHQYL